MDLSWRDAPAPHASQLVSQLLSPEAATAFLEKLNQEQETVKFRIVTSRDAPEFRRLIVSTDSINEINVSIAKRLNVRHTVPQCTWAHLTSPTGESYAGIALPFSSDYPCGTQETHTISQELTKLQKEFESRYGIKTVHDKHKRGDYFLLTDVSYAAYRNLFSPPSLLQALLSYSILNNEIRTDEVAATATARIVVSQI